jgi:sulfur carrier protein ThiS adenylyltransferase
MLAAIGAPEIVLIDFDKVDESNITTQGYSYKDVGKPKVEALGAYLRDHHDDVQITEVNDRFRIKHVRPPAVFSCVDNMGARELIWKGSHDRIGFWVDGRMMGEVMRVLAAVRKCKEDWEYYPTTLFDQQEATPGRCTAKTTIYAAEICAGYMVHQYTRFLRGFTVDRDVHFTLLAGSMDHLDAKETAYAE